EAHRDAIGSLQQCRSCHDAPNTYLNFSPEVHGVTLLSRTGPWVGISVAPAEQSGVAEHDILLSVNGQPVAGGDALDAIVQAWKQDAPPLTLRLLREG